MADNNCIFKVLAELSYTEYLNFLFIFPLTRGVGGQALSGKFHQFYFFIFETLPYPAPLH